ncbi:hypothetical protein [Robbsia andropogonis]|uniref:hypothetical protein n=1 Tax=Robbsia andropogonis TaxID=28092 RepID=UPI0012F81760|nr:hypothetical protein [Robbsia andropogonis]
MIWPTVRPPAPSMAHGPWTARLIVLLALSGATAQTNAVVTTVFAASAPRTASVAIASRTATSGASHASAVTPDDSTSFAVLANMPSSTDDERDTQITLQSIAHAAGVHFIVDLGNIRGADESCSDALFARRRALLDAVPAPVVFVPGMRDWVDCARPGAGGFDPVERLDAVRDAFLSGNQSLGTPAMRVIRQSELPAFIPYRENMRWIDDGVVFATLNVPGGNNHFLDGGGRNGEYEDREVANRNWIDHAVTDAERRHARGLVFLFAGDPGFASNATGARGNERDAAGTHWAAPFDWWFRRPHERDGYASLRRDLLQAVARFNGPVLIIHGRDTQRAKASRKSPRASDSTHGRSAQTAKQEKRDEASNEKRGVRVLDNTLPPVVALETLTRVPDGPVLHDVQQVMVDNPRGSRQWLRVTLPTATENRTTTRPARTVHGSAHRRKSEEGSGFHIRVERIDDAAFETASRTAPPPPAPSNASPDTPSSAPSTTRPASPMQPAGAPANGMGLPPWPGNAFRLNPAGTSREHEAQGIPTARPGPYQSGLASNAKSTSDYDVLSTASGIATHHAPTQDTPAVNTGALDDSPLPGEPEEPADPVETGLGDDADHSGTSALNGITRPEMLPLPPAR